MKALLPLVLCGVLALGCGDDTSTGGSGGVGGNGAGPADGGGGTGAGVDGGAPPGGAPQGGAPEGGGPDGGGGSGPVDCNNLPAGPIAATLATAAFSGSEDFAFDGSGGLVGKDGGSIVRVDAQDNKTTVATLAAGAFGLRYGLEDLFVALPQGNKLVRVSGGEVTDVATGLTGANGVYPDFDGNIWVTEFGGNRVTKVLASDGTKTTVAMGAGVSQPNGVVLDDVRGVLFFTNYSAGQVMRVDPAGGTPQLVGSVPNAALDGLVLDACGNLYAVDNGGNDLYRLNLDEAGALVGEAELMAQLPTSVANAQFGSGPGWSPTSLYVGGGTGSIYEVPVGVGGAPVPIPAD